MKMSQFFSIFILLSALVVGQIYTNINIDGIHDKIIAQRSFDTEKNYDVLSAPNETVALRYDHCMIMPDGFLFLCKRQMDNHNIYDPINGKVTMPISGSANFSLNLSIYFRDIRPHNLKLYVFINGAQKGDPYITIARANFGNEALVNFSSTIVDGHLPVKIMAGDFLRFRLIDEQSSTIDLVRSTLSFERMSP